MYVLHAYVLLCDSLKINRADHMLITRIFYVTTGWDRAFFPVPVPHPPCSYLFFKLAMKFSIVTTSSSTKSCTPTSWLFWCSAIVVAVVLCYFFLRFFRCWCCCYYTAAPLTSRSHHAFSLHPFFFCWIIFRVHFTASQSVDCASRPFDALLLCVTNTELPRQAGRSRVFFFNGRWFFLCYFKNTPVLY